MFHNDEINYESKLTEEVIRNNFKIVAEMEAVASLKEKILDKYYGNTTNQLKECFHNFGKEVLTEYGVVFLSNKAAKSINNHRFNELKAWGIGAIKQVLENGKALFYRTNYKKENKNRLFIVAPVVILEGKYIGHYMMGVAVDISQTTNRVQLIELVLNKEGESYGTTIGKKPTHGVEDSPSTITLLQQVIAVKNGTLDLDQVTAIGIDSE
ncbi:MAG: hypothetical protein IJ889_04085 [Eubacterium sp.]|nr:hypothetical protein [Eubacterium sp.]